MLPFHLPDIVHNICRLVATDGGNQRTGAVSYPDCGFAFAALLASRLTLLLVPILYLMLADFQELVGRLVHRKPSVSVSGYDVAA